MATARSCSGLRAPRFGRGAFDAGGEGDRGRTAIARKWIETNKQSMLTVMTAAVLELYRGELGGCRVESDGGQRMLP